uniref:EGF-like domain-containing protein n=1 Tax=Heterorhabditis bacteriophora TaxID=37862 RepID=A0A1I7XFL3_HETBA
MAHAWRRKRIFIVCAARALLEEHVRLINLHTVNVKILIMFVAWFWGRRPVFVQMGPTCDSLLANPCQPSPCNNGGNCIVTDGHFDCICKPDWSGATCSEKISCLVEGKPCENFGSCVRGLAINHCECVEGFSGQLCEIRDVRREQCQDKPCNNGGVRPLHYISEWDSSVHEINMITSTDSVWNNTTTITTMVPPTNTQSHEEISCNACHNSDVCIETSKGAICICEKGYMGVRCERQGDVCSALSCPEHQLCRPVITATDVQTKCGCPIGFTGKECKTGTAASFSENSIFIYQSPHVMIGSSSGPLPYVLSLSFRTTVPTVHIASGENIFGERLFSLRLIESRLAVNISGTLYNKLVPTNLNDGNWKILHVNKSEKDFEISLLDEFGYQLLSQTLPRLSSFDVFSTRIGKISDSDLFIGCMADVDIDGSTIEIASSNRGIGIVNEEMRGNKFRCVQAANTFPSAPSPRVITAVLVSTSGRTLLVFVVLHFCLLFVCTVSLQVHLDMAIKALLPKLVRSRAGRKAIHELISQKRIDDNEDHVLYIDDVIESEGDIPSRFNHPMFIEKIQLGSSDAINKDAFTTSDYFKGSLQDIQVNGASIILHQHPKFEVDQLGRVSKLQNVLEVIHY